MSRPEIGLHNKLEQMGQEGKKAEVVGAYLRGGVTLRELGLRHGIGVSTIHRWVKEYERAAGATGQTAATGPPGGSSKEGWEKLVAKDAELSADVRRLRKELEEARLYNRLLNAMIDIAEEQFEIPIRKKPGARRR